MPIHRLWQLPTVLPNDDDVDDVDDDDHVDVFVVDVVRHVDIDMNQLN